MLYTKNQVQQNLRNKEGKRVFYLGREDHLTSEARDFLRAERIEILSPEELKDRSYRTLNGGVLQEKPEHFTHLNGDVLVPKTHPRIRFRGMVDQVEAEILLCQEAFPGIREELGEILTLLRRLIRCDVLDEPVGEFTLCGLSQEAQRRHSHLPQDYYGIPHFMPEYTDGKVILILNRLRTLIRKTELAAVDAFSDRDGHLTREDIIQALNRMSSIFYILMLREKAGK